MLSNFYFSMYLISIFKIKFLIINVLNNIFKTLVNITSYLIYCFTKMNQPRGKHSPYFSKQKHIINKKEKEGKIFMGE